MEDTFQTGYILAHIYPREKIRGKDGAREPKRRGSTRVTRSLLLGLLRAAGTASSRSLVLPLILPLVLLLVLPPVLPRPRWACPATHVSTSAASSSVACWYPRRRPSCAASPRALMSRSLLCVRVGLNLSISRSTRRSRSCRSSAPHRVHAHWRVAGGENSRHTHEGEEGE